MRQFLKGFGMLPQYIDYTVIPLLLFSFGTFDSFLAGRVCRTEIGMGYVALLKQPINQSKPVQQIRKRGFITYCPNLYTVNAALETWMLGHEIPFVC